MVPYHPLKLLVIAKRRCQKFEHQHDLKYGLGGIDTLINI